MKKLSFAGLASTLAVLVTAPHAVPVADACGVKLVVKTPAPRLGASRSSFPSSVLLLGTPSNRLTRELAAKGHTIEVAPDASAAKRAGYSVVLTDAQHASQARAKFGNAVVLVRSSDVSSDVRSVENYVSRRPVSSDDRAVIAARQVRKPIAAGPTVPEGDRRVIAARTPELPTRTIAPPPTPKPEPAVTTAVPKPEPVAVTPKPEPVTPKPEPVAVSTSRPSAEPPANRPAAPAATVKPQRVEIYFGVGKSALSRQAQLARVVTWMSANPDVSIVIEGHADPSGTPEANLALSQTRADAVRAFLVDKGIDGARIEVQAFGDTKLKYGARDGRNRRVAIEPSP